MLNNSLYNSIVRYIAFVFVLIVAISCENDITVVNSLKVDENTPIESSYDVRMEYSDSGKLVMVMNSLEVNRYPTEDEYLEMPRGMTLFFYDSIGNIRSDLKSEYAINYVDKKIMEARINVVATNSKGDKLYTEILIWDQKKKSIYTDAPVRVVQKGKTLFGDGLIADESFDDYEITNPRAIFDIETGENNTDTLKKEEVKSSNEKKEEVSEEDEFSDFDKY